MKRASWIVTGALAAVASVVGFAPAAGAKGHGGGWVSYSVPFTCGVNSGDVARAVPGTYAAAAALHNGGTAEAMLSESVSLSYPPSMQGVGEVSDSLVSSLAAGAALQVDCDEILGGAFTFPSGAPASAYVQGFLVILSSVPLDVSLTQTASGATGDVSVEVEPVAGHPVDRLGTEDHKVDVCHLPRGNHDNAHTISVDMSAVPALLSQGDSLGECED